MGNPSSFLPLLLLLLLLTPATATTDDGDDWAFSDEGWRTATATPTNDTDPSSSTLPTHGACGFGDSSTPYGDYGAALSTLLFTRGSICGACFEVRCVDHVLWCLPGSPSVVLTATDFCAPNYGLASDYGGWCNFPRRHFLLSRPAFSDIASSKADIVPVHYRRVPCERDGGMRFKVDGNADFCQVLITNVGSDGEVVAVKIKGSRTGWIPMARNWGQYWESSVNLKGQPLSFEVTTSKGKTMASYNVVPANWQFGQTFEGKQIYD